jgi:hypothetical protein
MATRKPKPSTEATKAKHAACRRAVMDAAGACKPKKVEGLDGFAAIADLMRALPEWKTSAVFEAIARLVLEHRLTSVIPHRARHPTHIRIKAKGARNV